MRTINWFLLMKKLIVLIVMVAVAAAITACDDGLDNINYGETYVPGQDFQYTFANQSDGKTSIQKGEQGYYFCMDSFLYYMDTENMKALPVCNKPNCLHNKETDSSRLSDCNAYLSATLTNSDFYFINNQLFVLRDESYFDDTNFVIVNSIYEINPDGTNVKKLFSTDKQIVNWMIHRGKIYYLVDDGTTIWSHDIHNNINQEIFHLDELGLYGVQMSDMFAYANSIYMSISGYETENDYNNMLNGNPANTFEGLSVYHILEEKTSLISPETTYEGVTYQGFTEDQLTCSEINLEKKDKIFYKISDDDTKERLDIASQGLYDLYYNDSSYIYIRRANSLEDINKNIYEIYDKQNNYITRIDFPDGYTNNFIIGDDKYLFYVEDTEQRKALYYIDKASISKGSAELKLIYSSD